MSDGSPSDLGAALGAQPQTLALTGQQRLLVMPHPGGDMVQFLDRGGRLTLTVVLTEQGPVLRFEGASLTLQTTGDLAIEAEHLSLHGRAGTSITTGGDLDIQASGDLHSEARAQSLEATLGDVRLRANDDVKMTGERIRMNC